MTPAAGRDDADSVRYALMRLLPAARNAIYPGPGNPDYAKGPLNTMLALQRRSIVVHVSGWTSGGGRGATLTPLGKAIRAELAKEAVPPTPGTRAG